jgi:hypothetical protein
MVSCDKFGLEYHLPSLQKVRAYFYSQGDWDDNVEERGDCIKACN